MKTVEVTDKAFDSIKFLREKGDFNFQKETIANSLSFLADLINIGRDCEEVRACVNDILRVQIVLSSYNTLINELYDTSESTLGIYEYQQS